MKRKELIQWAQEQLNEFSSSLLESEVLLSWVLDVSRTSLKSSGDMEVSENDVHRYRDYVFQRKQHIPMAYIKGIKKWHDFTVHVNRKVLIPRDETEVLCEHIRHIWILEQNTHPHWVLDVGTGSGVIAFYMLHYFSKTNVFATDISMDALAIAQKNTYQYQDRIEFCVSNLFSDIPSRHYDIIVANLPYIPDDLEISDDVRHEPSIALFSGKDGLDHIRLFWNQLCKSNITFTYVWLEFLPSQKSSIEEILFGASYEFFTDIGGDVFFVCIRGHHE